MENRRRFRLLGWAVALAAAALGVGLLFGGWSGTQAASKSGEKPDRRGPGKDVRVVVVNDGDDDPEVDVEAAEGDERPNGAYLGVTLGEDTENPEGGAKVESVAEGSPADKAGIKDGDTIVGFGGSVIRGPVRLSQKIHAANAGDKVEVKIVRKNGARETTTVELGKRSKAHGLWYGFGDEGARALKDLPNKLKGLSELKGLGPQGRYWMLGHGRPKLGVQLVETTPELRTHLGGKDDAGVLVGKVLPGTPAEKAGIRVGDLIVSVDGDQVAEAGDLIEALSDKDGKTIEMDLVRDGRTLHLRVPLPKQEEEEDPPTGPRAMLAPLPPPPLPSLPACSPMPAPALAPSPPAPPLPPAPPAAQFI